ncbi:MAG: helix-turn-helix transcriptional regulator [Rivularia sp. (in: Bacteria)]|nr:helix-turn-helix transcriptional regulator [Rivularia sp. MS3]
MNVSVLEQYQKLSSTNSNIFYDSKPKYNKTQPASQLNLMQAVIESFVDGIFVITAKGELIHANERAGNICEKLSKNIYKGEIPLEIRRICDSLIESRQMFPQQKILLESEIKTKSLLTIRVRVRWLQANSGNDDYIIVTLEDREQTNQSIAISEAKKYGLTERETDVWLLRRANYSYQEIAEKLYITINTVKKHLKNIYAKQQEAFID